MADEMKGYPFVSIIVPIYNAGRTITGCLESIFRQEYPSDRYEVIVVDDGSTDGGYKIVERFPVSLKREKNSGPAMARNIGFGRSKGEIVIFLDGDCVVGRDWLNLHVREHMLNGEAGCIGGAFGLPEESNFFEICDYYSCWYEQNPRCPPSDNYEYLPSTNISFKRRVFENIGGFDVALRSGEDVDICRRLSDVNKRVLFRPHIVISHYGRRNFSGFLNHHYRWGRHGPLVRRFGSGRRFHFLFINNVIWSVCLVLPIALGYTIFIVIRWLSSVPLRIISLVPMVFMAKLAYAIGVVRGTLDVKGKARFPKKRKSPLRIEKQGEESMALRVLKYAAFSKFRLPAHIILHVTYRCNSVCQTCFNWKNLNAGKTEMSLFEFEKLSRGLGKLIWLHISGGESFLRDDLSSICELFARNNRPSFISIPTAGLEPDRVEKIGSEILSRIKIPITIALALDDLGEKNDEIRGVPGSFDKVLESYEVLMRMSERFRHLSTRITTVISNKNFDNLEGIIDFVYHKMKGIGFHTIILMRGNPRNPNLKLPSVERLNAQKPALFKAWARYSYDNNIALPYRFVENSVHMLLWDLYLRMMRENKNCIPCLAGRSHIVIGADGEVSFCELLDGVGNIRDYDFQFEQLWHSPRAEAMRDFVKAGRCWCTHGCVHMDNLFFNIKMYPSLLRNSAHYMFWQLNNRNSLHFAEKEVRYESRVDQSVS